MLLDGKLFAAKGDAGADYVQLQRASTSGTLREVEFAASKSNAIYGKSSTVQPAALLCKFCIKY
jgi:hypothetical protein